MKITRDGHTVTVTERHGSASRSKTCKSESGAKGLETRLRRSEAAARAWLGKDRPRVPPRTAALPEAADALHRAAEAEAALAAERAVRRELEVKLHCAETDAATWRAMVSRMEAENERLRAELAQPAWRRLLG